MDWEHSTRGKGEVGVHFDSTESYHIGENKEEEQGRRITFSDWDFQWRLQNLVQEEDQAQFQTKPKQGFKSREYFHHQRATCFLTSRWSDYTFFYYLNNFTWSIAGYEN